MTKNDVTGIIFNNFFLHKRNIHDTFADITN